MKRRVFLIVSVIAMAVIMFNTSQAKDTSITGKATADGFGGADAITVTITIDEGKIVDAKAEGPKETEGIGAVAVVKLPAEMVEKNAINVDAMTGATISSTGILKAAEAALVAAGVNPEDFKIKAPAAAVAEEKVFEADIAIIGAGGAGMVAAITAADAGKKVVLIEKQAMVGGNSVRSTGGMNAAHTPEQDNNKFGESAGVEKTLKAAEKFADNKFVADLAKKVKAQYDAWNADPKGYFDSVELMELDTIIGGHGINEPALVKALCENTADAIEWLKTVNIDLSSVGAFGGASVKRIHRPVDENKKVVSVGAYMIPRLEAACKERANITLLTETMAKSLMTDEAGKICGVEAESKGNKVTIKSKSVILATGGFGANLKMVAILEPSLNGFMTTNAPGATGEGIVMAQELGAAVVDMKQIQIHPTVQFDTSALITEGLRGDGAILVNTEGKRFIDEVLARDVVSKAEIDQPNSFAWLVIDQKMADDSSVIKGYISKGYTFKGDTYEELAAAINVPADAFAKTMNTWNGYVKEKSDPEFGRTSFAFPLEKAPFYAIKVTPGIHHTMGGLKIDTAARVLRGNGEIIPGLYAAGEVTGGVHGGNRLGGTAVADFVVFGRIAGQSASGIIKTKTSVTGTATADGFGGADAITVTVTVDDGKIINVNAEGPKETQGIGSVALEKLPAEMVEKNTIKVDAMTGASLSSAGILKAAEAALVNAGLNPEDFKREVVDANAGEEKIFETDIAIIGAGGAGMIAAITAADAGKKVIIVEKQAMVGGNSVRATGGMNAAHTPEQSGNKFNEAAGVEKTLKTAADKWADHKVISELAAKVKEQYEAWKADGSKGYFDSAELMQLDTIIGGHGINDPVLIKALCENSAEAVAWLKTVDIDLSSVGAAGGASVKRIHRPVDENKKVLSVGAYMIPRLEAACKARPNITLMTETMAKAILTDDKGAVCGVEAESKGSKVTIKSRAVVIAAGGFGANLKMVAELNPALEGFMTTNAPGAMGEGIVMAQKIGAGVVDMDQIQIHPTVQFDSSNLITEGLRGDGAILVNIEGKRFIDEVLTRDVVSKAEIAQPKSFAWLVIDQKMVDESSVIKGYIAKGYTFKGETYEDLAKEIDVPADVFANTVKTWNGYVKDRNDPDFGRTSFIEPLDTAPFYAIKVTPGIHHTMGGLKIDATAHVLKDNGEAIPGLFAAGEVTGGVHGGNRLGGTAVADFVVYGRIAGKSAAEF